MNCKNDKTNNELIDKNQYSFCISLISQLIEEIELEYNSNKNNAYKKIFFSIFSLLKYQMKLFHDLFFIKNKQLYNITQFKEIKNLFDNGKENIKRILNDIISYQKPNYGKKPTKSNISNCVDSSHNTHSILNNKNSSKKKYNTKTFNKKINNYLIKNEERKLTNENIATTIPKSIDVTNNNCNSISSFHIFKQNKFKKNINNIKKNHSKRYKNINNKTKTKKEYIDNKYQNYIANTENKIFENNENLYYKSNSKNSINNTNSNKNNPQKIIVNQIKRANTNINVNQDINKNRNYILANINQESPYKEENPVRKVKNIIINAKSLSSLNIDVINQYYTNKGSSKDKIKNSNLLNSFSKINNNEINMKNDNKTYGSTFYCNQTEKKINIKSLSKDRKCNEILIDGMNNIKMKLNSIGKNKKFKKAKSISDLNYIKEIFINK